MESLARAHDQKVANGDDQTMRRTRDHSHHQQKQHQAAAMRELFKMPLHYPRYTKADYESMPEWMLDRLLSQYGLPVNGSLDQKRKFAMGAFLWAY